MSSEINKPTGLGYVFGNRICQNPKCGHSELNHYGRCLYHPACTCSGFAARELDQAELDILAEDQTETETKYVGEAWLDEFVDDFKKYSND